MRPAPAGLCLAGWLLRGIQEFGLVFSIPAHTLQKFPATLQFPEADLSGAPELHALCRISPKEFQQMLSMLFKEDGAWCAGVALR